MNRQILHRIALVLALVVASGVTAAPRSERQTKDDAVRTHSIDLTAAALLDQIKCQRTPQVARAINAMLENRLIRYVDNESGAYLFEPTAPLTLLGLRVLHVSGFDNAEAFKRAPFSTMVGPAPPVHLEIDVAAPASELRKRALAAGLVEAAPADHKAGFEVSAKGWNSYLAGESHAVTSSIRCVKSLSD